MSTEVFNPRWHHGGRAFPDKLNSRSVRGWSELHLLGLDPLFITCTSLGEPRGSRCQRGPWGTILVHQVPFDSGLYQDCVVFGFVWFSFNSYLYYFILFYFNIDIILSKLLSIWFGSVQVSIRIRIWFVSPHFEFGSNMDQIIRFGLVLPNLSLYKTTSLWFKSQSLISWYFLNFLIEILLL